MKILITLVIAVFPIILLAQTGGVVLSFSFDDEKAKSSNPVEIEIWQDTVLLRKDTVDGVKIIRDLPVGVLALSCWYEGQNFLEYDALNIQSKQLVYASYTIDATLIARQNNRGSKYDLIPGIGELRLPVTQLEVRPRNPGTYHIDGVSVRSQELAGVSITSNKVSLIMRDGGSCCGAVITREDISRMPSRSITGITSTFGGVMSTENSDVHMRGARSDANAYYIDGMRMSNVQGIPKASINQVGVYLGGIPAKYGDLTGGVVVVETKSSFNNSPVHYRPGSGRTRRNQYVHYEEPQIEPKLDFDHFTEIYENDFLSPLAHPNSTFGIDVDQASWTYIKECYSRRATIDRDAVKLEEMINSFQQKEVELKEDELIGLEIDRNSCAWNPKNELVTIRLKAKDLPKDQPRISHNIVLLVDVSGSMEQRNKLPLLISGLKEFVKSLCETDRISIVTYAGTSGVVLEPTDCSKQKTILSAISSLQSGGSTNGIGGITMAYELAEKHFDPTFNNRIILATDGDFNVGISSPTELIEYISTKRGEGIYITALGFGMGNYNSSTLEAIADNGDGNHFYINNLRECRKVLMHDLGNLINIARDVKLNVEFNPRLVKEYRLIGYENRLMPSQDFDDDNKDGGEMGYNHTVTAVYEIKRGKEVKSKSHFVKSKATFDNQELAFVKLRYKPMEDSTSIEQKFSLKEENEIVENQLVNLIISLGLQLRNSAFKGNITEETLAAQAVAFKPKNEDERELKEMVLSLNTQK